MTITATRKQFEAARTRLAARGTHLDGDCGSVSHDGVTLAFDFVEPTLNITTHKKPFYVSEGAIETEVRNWFVPIILVN